VSEISGASAAAPVSTVDPRSFPHAEPMPYHLVLRTWSYAWWRPVLGALICMAAFFVLSAVVFLVVASVWALFQDGSWAGNVGDNIDTENLGAPGLLGLNLGIGSMILVTWFVIRVVHRMRPRWLASVVPRLRWRFLGACLGLAVLALLAQVLAGTVLPSQAGDELGAELNSFTVATAISALVVLLTTPLQAAGEEYLFRGYLMQAFGSFSGSRWVAILGTATLFALAHGTQNFPLFFDRFAFGVIAGWLVTRTGGLEAGIALHIINNFVAFGFALSFGDLSTTLNVTEVSWWNIVLTLTQSAVYTALVLLVARSFGLQTRTRPPGNAVEPATGPTVRTA
jgi:membrane protease YdiL (CAAX protease family)